MAHWSEAAQVPILETEATFPQAQIEYHTLFVTSVIHSYINYNIFAGHDA
jgi:hypothetical protein